MTTIETLNNGESGLSHRNKLNNNFLALNTDKVEVVAGKGLSENDYTTAEKSKLAGIEAGAQVNVGNEYTTAEQSKLAGIEAGAEVNTLADVVAGTNITIDKTDPLNPVINSTGGGGGGGGDMLKVTYDTQGIEADAFDRDNHTGTQLASTISDFDSQVANNTDVTENTANRNLLKVSSNDTTANYLESKLVAGTNVTLTTVNEGADEVINISASGSGDTINYYNSYRAPQLFNPDSGQVTAGAGNFTLVATSEVGIVTINGQVLDDSEYSLSGTTLTVTPDNGFEDITDEILVYQSKTTADGIDLGWGFYDDNTHTSASPLEVNSSRVQITIDGLGPNTETSFLPSTGDLWVGNKIIMPELGNSFTMRLDWKAKANSNNSYYDIELDIGDASPIVIIKDTLTMVKGINVEQSFSRTFSGFALANFITNGGKIYFDSSADGVNLDIYDLQINISKTK